MLLDIIPLDGTILDEWGIIEVHLINLSVAILYLIPILEKNATHHSHSLLVS